MNLRASVALGLVIAVGGVFFQVHDHAFVNYDDLMYLSKLQAELNAGSIWLAFTRPFQVNWIPLTWISMLADHALYGDEPAGYLLTNAALHALAAVLLFLAFERMTGAVWPSAFVAAVFAIHPLHVESVAWMSERKDVLSGVFFSFTLLAYARWAERPTAWRYALVALGLALGLLAKPSVVTLPCVLLLLDYWPLERLRADPARRLPDAARLGRALLEKLPLFALVAGVSAATLVAQRASPAFAASEAIYPFGVRLANALHSYIVYVWQSVWPSGLAVFYPHPGDGIPAGWTAAAAAALAAVTLAVARAAAARPYLAVGWLWYLGTLVPMIGLVQVGGQAHADRYMYLPLIGLALLLAFGGADLLGRRRAGRIALAIAGSAALVGLAAVAFLQVRHWRDTTSLFERAVAVTEANAFAHSSLGGAYQKTGRLEEAEVHLAEAVRLSPEWAVPRLRLGNVYAALQRWQDALAHYERGLASQPGNAGARLDLAQALIRLRRYDEASAELERAAQQSDGLAPTRRFSLHEALARTSWERGRPGDAIRHHRRALEIWLDHPGPETDIGLILARSARFDEALPHLRRAIAHWRPESSEAYAARGAEAAATGLPRHAVRFYREALRLRPDLPLAADHLAWILATTPDAEIRDPDAAIRLAQTALSERSSNAILLDTLAAGYAAGDRFPEAVRTAEKAARDLPDGIFAAQVRARLASYRAGTPYVERRAGAGEPMTTPDL
jgi:tetratricopeptide (TPR) repeat protein